MARLALVIALAACGRVNFDPLRSSGDGPPGADAAIDAPVIPAGPVLWLQMETIPTQGIVDSGAGHVVACDAGTCPERVVGIHGQGYRFRGETLTIKYRADLDESGGFTSALWVFLDQLPAVQSCVFEHAFAQGDSFVFCINTDGSVSYDNEDAGGAPNVLSGANLTSDVWHHLAFVWNGTIKTAYQDGVFVDMVNFGVGTGTSDLTVGSIDNAIIDDVVVYDRALTAQEITQLATP